MKVELLAPAGSLESFYAAVNSGADSVYLGGKLFNARNYARNFDEEEMKHIVKYAHNKGVKVYVTMNTVLKDIEITDALNYAAFLYENDVDALIVQDLGFLHLLNKYLPDFPVNISTQAVVYDEFGVKFYRFWGKKSDHGKGTVHRGAKRGGKKYKDRFGSFHSWSPLHLLFRSMLHVKFSWREERQPGEMCPALQVGLHFLRKGNKIGN